MAGLKRNQTSLRHVPFALPVKEGGIETAVAGTKRLASSALKAYLFPTQPPRSFLVGWPVVTSSVGHKVGITHLNAGSQVSSFPKYCRRERSLLLNYLWLSPSCICKGWVGWGGRLRWISRFGNHAKYKRWAKSKFLKGANFAQVPDRVRVFKIAYCRGEEEERELLHVQKDDQD